MEKVTDKTEALSAIKKETLALENVSDELKADKEVVMAAVELGSWEFEHASDELKADKEFVLEVIKINVDQFNTASDELKADKEFVMTAVELSGWALEYASDELKADKEMELLNKNFNSMIDKLKNQQEKLLSNERHEAWETVARKMAHEIKNPLTPIQLTINNLN